MQMMRALPPPLGLTPYLHAKVKDADIERYLQQVAVPTHTASSGLNGRSFRGKRDVSFDGDSSPRGGGGGDRGGGGGGPVEYVLFNEVLSCLTRHGYKDVVARLHKSAASQEREAAVIRKLVESKLSRKQSELLLKPCDDKDYNEEHYSLLIQKVWREKVKQKQDEQQELAEALSVTEATESDTNETSGKSSRRKGLRGKLKLGSRNSRKSGASEKSDGDDSPSSSKRSSKRLAYASPSPRIRGRAPGERAGPNHSASPAPA
jgi:hypothetical protein